MKDYIKRFCLYFLFSIVLYLLFISFIFITGQQHVFLDFRFNCWDAGHYYNIRTNGYSGYLTAFFPAFPMFWKLTGLGYFGISLVNWIIFHLGFTWLSKDRKWNLQRSLLYLSFPTLVFTFLPYTESIFFAFITMYIVGLRNNNSKLVIAGLILASFTRPTTAVMIPATLIAEALCSRSKRDFLKSTLINSASILLGTILAFLVHHYYTGKWFSFFTSQLRWENYFRLPFRPLKTWGDMLIVDGFSLYVGLFMGYFLLSILFSRIRKQEVPERVEVYSLLYLFGTALFILFFRGGSLFSLNRFIWAVPFIYIALDYMRNHIKFTWTNLLILVVSYIVFTMFFFLSYLHVKSLLYFNQVLPLLVVMFLWLAGKGKIEKISYGLLLSTFILIHTYFLLLIHRHEWIG